MKSFTNEYASAQILKAVDENRLVQSAWHIHGDDGRELACLLGSIDPKVTSAKECNADLMPLWLAETTVTLFDKLPAAEVVPIGRRYGQLIGQWGALTTTQWDDILTAFLVRCIDNALEAARPVAEGKPYWAAVEKASKECRAAVISKDKADAAYARTAAGRAAADAADAYACADAYAARAAADAADAYACADAYAARAAADAARTAAGRAAARAAGRAAGRAAAHKLFSFLLDEIERCLEG